MFQRIQSLEIYIDEYNNLFDSDLLEEYKHIWGPLSEKEWISISDNRINIVGDGAFFTPIIQGLVANERKNEILNEIKNQS
ncbi:MAG: hypothetical protein GY754_32015 [bacterium]|nr:hypothetical protein [bacterium]